MSFEEQDEGAPLPPPPGVPPAAPDAVSLVQYLLIALGIFLGLVGSILINVGNNVQALGMGMVEDQKAQVGLTPSKRPKRIWAAGTVIFIVGSVINFVAFVFAAAAVLAPLEAIQFVSNLVFARYVTKATVSRKMVGGSALIVAGTIGAVASGPMSVYKFSIPQLQRFWESPLWITYVIVVWCTSLAMQAFWHAQQRKIRAGGEAWGPPALMPILYAASSALIGTQSVVQAKAFSELIEVWLSGQALIWVHWLTYAVLGYFVVTVGFWLYRLNAALSKYDPLYIIPLLQSSYIVFATLAGGIYFQEFQTLQWWQLLIFASCIGVMIGGLYLLIPPMGGGNAQRQQPVAKGHVEDKRERRQPRQRHDSSETPIQERPTPPSPPSGDEPAEGSEGSPQQHEQRKPLSPKKTEQKKLEDGDDLVWKMPSGEPFFRLAHSVSFANTESFKRKAHDGVGSIYDGAGVGLQIPAVFMAASPLDQGPAHSRDWSPKMRERRERRAARRSVMSLPVVAAPVAAPQDEPSRPGSPARIHPPPPGEGGEAPHAVADRWQRRAARRSRELANTEIPAMVDELAATTSTRPAGDLPNQV